MFGTLHGWLPSTKSPAQLPAPVTAEGTEPALLGAGIDEMPSLSPNPEGKASRLELLKATLEVEEKLLETLQQRILETKQAILDLAD